MMSTANGRSYGRLVVVGISHHTTALDLRERLVLHPEQWYEATSHALPTVLLSTCNRVEVYAWADRRGAGVSARIGRMLSRLTGVPRAALEPCLFTYAGIEAVLHLLRVVAGFDSLIPGEDQIRGQVRAAYRLAGELTALSAPLHGVFSRALEAGRRLRATTQLATHPSVATAAVAVAQRSPELALTGLAGRSAIVLGAGAMAKLAAHALVAAGARLTLLNRTLEHGERLADGLGAPVSVGPLSALAQVLRDASLLVGATASQRPLLDAATVERAMRRRPQHPLVILDVALPRNVDPSVRDLPAVRLIDLDDLERLCPVDGATRRAEIEWAEALALDEARKIARWLRMRAVGPSVVELLGYGDEVRAIELRRFSSRLRGLTPEQHAAVDALAEGIVRKLLHGPMVALREAAASSGGAAPSRSTVFDILRLDRARHRRR